MFRDSLRYLSGMLLCAMVVTMPAAHAKSLARTALDKAVELKCHAALNESKLWKTARFMMSDATADAKQTEICSCVGEHALNDVKGSQVLKATFDEHEKQQLIKQAVLNSLRGCSAEVLGAK